MRNIIFTVILLFPFIVTCFVIGKVAAIDSNLQLVKEHPILKDNHREKLFIDKHASKRRIYFYVEDNSKILKYERDYRGFISDWSVLFNNKKFVNSNTLSFYVDADQKKMDKENIPFFGLNNEKKNFSYYFDVFQYVKDNNFFLLLVIFLAYAFIGGGGIDRFGGITQYKTIGILFFFDIVYFLLLLFW